MHINKTMFAVLFSIGLVPSALALTITGRGTTGTPEMQRLTNEVRAFQDYVRIEDEKLKEDYNDLQVKLRDQAAKILILEKTINQLVSEDRKTEALSAETQNSFCSNNQTLHLCRQYTMKQAMFPGAKNRKGYLETFDTGMECVPLNGSEIETYIGDGKDGPWPSSVTPGWKDARLLFSIQCK